MSLFNMLRSKRFQKHWDWIDGLTEIGGYHEVGTGMIVKLHEVIRETYKAGFEDGKKCVPPRKVHTPRGVRGRNFSRPRTK